MIFKLELTDQELNLIGHALSQLPYKDVAQLFGKIQGLVAAQAPPPPKPAEDSGGSAG